MVEISVEGDRAVFTVLGWHKLWSLRSRLEIPLAHVRDVHADPSPACWGWFQEGQKVDGVVGGIAWPNVFRAGRFYQDGGWVFWDVRHPENTIVVELHDETYQKLVVEVADPAAAVQLLKQALAQPRA
jgi:hypothetical protein